MPFTNGFSWGWYLVSLLGLPQARELAQELRGEAHAALEGLGGRGRRLAELADFIVLRKF